MHDALTHAMHNARHRERNTESARIPPVKTLLVMIQGARTLAWTVLREQKRGLYAA